MGCAFSKCPSWLRKNKDDGDDNNEREGLLDNDYGKTPAQAVRDENHLNAANSITKTDEQSLLSTILHKTAQNIIDVSAIEPHSMERSEYMDKMRHYLEKTSNGDYHINKGRYLKNVTHSPMNILQANIISAADIKLITEASISIAARLSQIEVTCKEPLVETIGA